MIASDATKQDFQLLAEIYNRSVAPFYAIYSEEEKRVYDDMRYETAATMAEWAASCRLVCMRSDGGLPVGYAGFRRKNADIMWISAFYIDPDRQRSGIGTLLLKAVEDRAVQDDIACIALETHHKADWALSFYQKNGYIVANDLLQDYPYNKILDKPPVAGRPLLAKVIIENK